MRIHLTDAGAITLRDSSDFRSLDILVDPQPPERLDRSIARIGTREGEDHVRLALPVLRFLSGHAGNPDWESGLAGMVAYATRAGWVNTNGEIRAHITRKASDDAVSPDEFKAAMRALPAGISVVTTGSGPTAAGIVISSLTSISAEPPLVGFFLNQQSSIHETLLGEGRFVANVIGEAHDDVLTSFLKTPQGPGRFCSGTWHEGHGGLPVLSDSLASMECDIVCTESLGTHRMIVGKIRRTSRRDANPVIHFNAVTRRLAHAAPR